MLRNRLLVNVLALAAVLSLAGAAFCADQVLLRRKVKPGEKYVAVVVSSQDMTRERSDGARLKMKQGARMEMAMEVLSVDAGALAEYKVTYRRIALTVDGPDGKIDYDSGDPAKMNLDNPALVEAKGRLGKSLIVRMTDRGEVKGVKGMEEITRAVLALVPEGRDRDAARQQLALTMTEENVSQQMAAFAVRLPEEAKAPGDSWAWDQKVDARFAILDVKTTYQLDKISPDAVEMSGVAVAKIAQVPPGTSVTLDPTSTATGRTSLNRDNAAVFTSDLNQTTKLTATYQGQTIKNTMTSVSKITVQPEAAK